MSASRGGWRSRRSSLDSLSVPRMTVQKIVKKSMYWWRHGKHKGSLAMNLANLREASRLRAHRAAESAREMFGSVAEAFATARLRRHRRSR